MPPAANLRIQQQEFDRFRQEYNWERPHEALQMKTPGEVYAPSERIYPSRIAGPEYNGEWEVRAVGPCGTMRWNNSKLFVGKAFAGERIGLEPSGDGEWQLWFYGYPLAKLDERTGEIIEPKRRKQKGPLVEPAGE